MKEVYKFKVWDVAADRWNYPPSKRTAEWIKNARGVIITETMQRVDDSEVDGEGRFIPKTLA